MKEINDPKRCSLERSEAPGSAPEAPSAPASRPYRRPSVQTRGADALRGLLAGVSAATGFVQP